jgi:hypothetical protein
MRDTQHSSSLLAGCSFSSKEALRLLRVPLARPSKMLSNRALEGGITYTPHDDDRSDSGLHSPQRGQVRHVRQ